MNTMEIQLKNAKMILNRALSEPQILALLAQRGYGIAQLQEGLSLCEIAQQSFQGKDIARFDKVNGTQTFKEIWKEVKVRYTLDVQIARTALREYEGSNYLLWLSGKRMNSFDAWHQQAQDFYLGLRNQPELQAAVEKLGLTAEQINLGIEQLQNLETVRSQRQVLKGNAASTRRQTRQAFDAFKRWMSTFRQYARLALAATPEYLEMLELKPTSTKAKKSVIQPIHVEAPAVHAINLLPGD